MEKPDLVGVLETALFVDNPKRSAQFYMEVFGFEVLASSERLWALSVAERQVLLLFKHGASLEPIETDSGTLPGRIEATGRTHLAFAISASQLEAWEAWLKKQGIPIERKIESKTGGTSLYFRDPDQHCLELATPGTWAIY